MKVKLEIVFLGIILLFGLFIRVYNLGVAPLWIDESISSIAAKEILEKGAPVFDSGLFYSRALFYHYSEAFFLLFGVNDFNARIASVIFGLATILLVFFIGREYSKSGGVISALFMSVFYLEVFFSRQARFYQLFQLMFFLSLYLLYKSRKNSKLLYYALGALLIAIDTHTAGLVLTPFFIGFILLYHKPKWLASIPGALLLRDFISALRVSTSGVGESLRGVYFERYSWYLRNIHYMLVLFVPGVIWGFFKQRLLTLLLVVPALILLFSLLSVKVFAFRYMYFSIFILVLYSSLLISFLYEKYGKIVLISLVALVLLPSNLFFPLAGSIILDPVSTSFDDPSAPYTDYKSLDGSLVNDLRSGVLVSLFSSDVEWYIKKPDYVIPFSMSGMGNDSISLNGVDRYSGALILDYSFVSGYVIADGFSVSKLNSLQREEFDLFVNGCELVENNQDLRVYYCSESLKSK